MKLIKTKFHGPTNTKGARIQAFASGHRLFVPYDHSLDTEDNHSVAAWKLARKLLDVDHPVCIAAVWDDDTLIQLHLFDFDAIVAIPDYELRCEGIVAHK